MNLEQQYKKFISPDEKIITVLEYATSELIWDFFWGIIVLPFVFTLLFSLNTTTAIIGFLVGLLIGMWVPLIGLYKKVSLKYLITNQRVILKKGLIGQSTVSADYSKITDITVKQGILGRVILKTGTIVLNTAGTDISELDLKWVQDPFITKDLIYKQLQKK